MILRSLTFTFYLLLASPLFLKAQIQIEEKVRFLALGDSYTIGQSVATSLRWPVQLIDSLRAKGIECDDAQIIATTGWRTDNLKTAIQNANLPNTYNLVSLSIGVNNFFQGRTVESYIPQFSELLDESIKLAGGDISHVFVVSIPDYGYTPFGTNNQASISAGIDAFNAANKTISDEKGVTYIPITDISRQGLARPELVASDGLHPSGIMYAEWVNRIFENLALPKVVTETDTPEPPSIEIYPNPANSFIRIDNLPPNETHFRMVFRSTTGHAVFKTAFMSAGTKALIEIPGIIPGMYFYELSGRFGNLKTGKLIKQ